MDNMDRYYAFLQSLHIMLFETYLPIFYLFCLNHPDAKANIMERKSRPMMVSRTPYVLANIGSNVHLCLIKPRFEPRNRGFT